MARSDKDSNYGSFLMLVLIPVLIFGSIWAVYKIYRVCFEFFSHIFSCEISEITQRFFSGTFTLLPIYASYLVWIDESKQLSPVWLLYFFIAGIVLIMLFCFVAAVLKKREEPDYNYILEETDNQIEEEPVDDTEEEILEEPFETLTTQETENYTAPVNVNKPKPVFKPSPKKGRVLDY